MTTAANNFQRCNQKVSELHSSRRGILWSLVSFLATLEIFFTKLLQQHSLTDKRLQCRFSFNFKFPSQPFKSCNKCVGIFGCFTLTRAPVLKSLTETAADTQVIFQRTHLCHTGHLCAKETFLCIEQALTSLSQLSRCSFFHCSRLAK